MIYRKMDEAGDYVFGNGIADYYRDQPEVVAQAVSTRLGLWRGQWFLDLQDGMPWLEEVLGSHTARLRDAAIRQRILSTPGVNQIVAYKSDVEPETRKFVVQVVLETIYGQLFLSGGAYYSSGTLGAFSLRLGSLN